MCLPIITGEKEREGREREKERYIRFGRSGRGTKTKREMGMEQKGTRVGWGNRRETQSHWLRDQVALSGHDDAFVRSRASLPAGDSNAFPVYARVGGGKEGGERNDKASRGTNSPNVA